MSRLSLLLLLLIGALAIPASAGATLVFERGSYKGQVWTARDDGSGQRRLVQGDNPHISPDGTLVSYVTGKQTTLLKVIPAAGGTARTLLTDWRGGPFDWSADGRWIVTAGGPEIGTQKLYLIDVPAGTSRVLATGSFSNASFSPAGDQVVYDRSAAQTAFPRVDLYIAPVAGGPARALTTDHHSLNPLWGPTQIAFSHWARPTGRHRNEDGPKWNLWLISPDGTGTRALTKRRVPWLLTGLMATSWSADGTRLLSQFGGQDTSYAVGVEVPSGRQHVIGKNAEYGLAGAQLTADGATVLGATGGPDAQSAQEVVTMPWAGGRTTILARKAGLGSWSLGQ